MTFVIAAQLCRQPRPADKYAAAKMWQGQVPLDHAAFRFFGVFGVRDRI
jgi:hypothetical protein